MRPCGTFAVRSRGIYEALYGVFARRLRTAHEALVRDIREAFADITGHLRGVREAFAGRRRLQDIYGKRTEEMQG